MFGPTPRDVLVGAVNKTVQFRDGWALEYAKARAGLGKASRTGKRSPAHDDYKRPEAWVVTPPPGHPANPRRFDHTSPNPAVRWAYDQAMAPVPAVGGVAALVALATAAAASGVVAEGSDGASNAPLLPDAELQQLCGEIAGCRRIMDEPWRAHLDPQGQADAFRAMTARVGEASRTRERLIPRVIELPATTPAGVVAKARVVADLFGNSPGRRSAAARALLVDLDRVLTPKTP